MVDFKKLAAAPSAKLPKTLLETFSRLDRQVSHVELRPSQIKILELIDERSADRDLVVKLNTGGGKTTIGLLYLKHKLEHLKLPVVYLVPTTQLVDQVIAEGKRIGFPAVHWSQGQTYPPEEALAGRAAIVCTYDKFFNGRSTFARDDVKLIPGAVVLDDVHAGIEAIRKAFGSNIPEAARADLIDLLRADLEKLNPSDWFGVESGDYRALFEVPHWVFSAHIEGIRKILIAHSSEKELVFALPYLVPLLENCRLVLSGQGAYIGLDPPAVERVPHFNQAKHRLFMSASIHDGAVLIRELGCDPVSAANPVQIGNEAAVGERMVVVPSLIDPDFSREDVIRIAAAISTVSNVVVLVSSYQEAKPWEEAGARVALNETISEEISRLRSSPRGNLVVFVQRYDGIDLPDAACRLLIIDGLPKGESVLDRTDMQLFGGVEGLRGKVANKVEQGLGRAVRSASDYCGVLLAGRDVAGFVSRLIVLENFSPQTVRQIEIGRQVSEDLKSSADKVAGVIETLMQCLRRDGDWKDYYVSQMAVEPASSDLIKQNAETNREIATLERLASEQAAARDFAGASSLLQKAANISSKDRAARGILKQAASKFLYQVNHVEAMQLQASAFGDNYRISRPPTLLPAEVRKITAQAEAIAAWLSSFKEVNGALIELDELHAKLAFSNPTKQVEEAVRKLGALLGSDSSRPDLEHGRGPDNLWLFSDLAIVIEMKSEKASPLSKGDAEQLQSSALWVKENIAKVENILCVVGSNSDKADDLGDFAFGAKLLTEVDFRGMVERLRHLVTSVVAQGPLFSSSAANIQKYLGPNGLLSNQIALFARGIKQKK